MPRRGDVERDLVVLDPDVAVADDDAVLLEHAQVLRLQLLVVDPGADLLRVEPARLAERLDEERRDLLGVLDPQVAQLAHDSSFSKTTAPQCTCIPTRS